ncbi:MAG: restriction endonuclease subunit S [Succinivibrio sp.]
MDLSSKLSNLKNQLLELAIRGKLVEQRPEDGTAEDLYSQIQEEKKKLIAEGKIKKEKPFPKISENEIPFEIPDSWKWVRLGNIVSYGGGTQAQPSEINKDDWILDLEDIESSTSKVLRKKTNIVVNSNKFFFAKGNVLYGKMRPYLNKVIIADSYGYCSTEIIPLDFEQVGLCSKYFKFVLMSKYFVDYATNVSHGVNIPRLGTQEAKIALIPLPPLAEQKRIVEKLESHLAVILIAEELIIRRENLNVKIREKILQMTIEGKLVEQRPEEGTAEELYTRIQEEKKKLIAEGKVKKEKPLPKITDDDIPFDIPESWKWVRIGDLANYKKGPFGSALTKSIFVSKSDNAVKVYEQKNAIQKDSSLGSYYITKEYFEDKMSSFEVLPGDIIVSCAGTIGELYRLPSNIEKGIINQALMRVRLYEPMYCEFYELLFDYLIKDYSRKSSKGSAIKNIPPFDILKNYIIPLPPLAEQKRIVAKIEELLLSLMSLTDLPTTHRSTDTKFH